MGIITKGIVAKGIIGGTPIAAATTYYELNSGGPTNDWVGGGGTNWTGSTLSITTVNNSNSLYTRLSTLPAGSVFTFSNPGRTVTTSSVMTAGAPDPGTGYVTFTASTTAASGGFTQFLGNFTV